MGMALRNWSAIPILVPETILRFSPDAHFLGKVNVVGIIDPKELVFESVAHSGNTSNRNHSEPSR